MIKIPRQVSFFHLRFNVANKQIIDTKNLGDQICSAGGQTHCEARSRSGVSTDVDSSWGNVRHGLQHLTLSESRIAHYQHVRITTDWNPVLNTHTHTPTYKYSSTLTQAMEYHLFQIVKFYV